MKPPVDRVDVSPRGKDTLITAKRNTGLTQWNELLRWAFCLSLSNPAKPKTIEREKGLDPVEWKTFAGEHDESLCAAFYLRASKDGIDVSNSNSVSTYFHAHIERGVNSLRSLKSLTKLVDSHTL